ncbi:hypothetical protein BDR04DRAFT_1148250 [Suillus decipiens]|nr:hypothetical protein BDR04DRAFT_1148250 [Suillus decipiens]
MKTTARNACITGDLPTIDSPLTQDIGADGNDYNSFANRLFIKARDYALDDALKSISIQPSLMGCITHCGKRQFQDAMKAFDLAFMVHQFYPVLLATYTAAVRSSSPSMQINMTRQFSESKSQATTHSNIKLSYLSNRETFKQDCGVLYTVARVTNLATSGDAALAAGNYDKVAGLYSATIDLDFATSTIFVTRSKARLGKILSDDILLGVETV